MAQLVATQTRIDWPPTEELVDLVQEHGQTEAARRLDVGRMTLKGRLESQGVPPEKQRKTRQKVSAVDRAAEIPAEPDVPTEAEQLLAKKALKQEELRGAARAEATAAKREVKALTAENDELRGALELVTAVENVKRPEWLAPPSQQTRAHHGTLVACWSDYHIGEAVAPGEMNDYNAYSVDIAEQRSRRFFERVILVSRDYLAGVKYDGIVLPNLGDTISGDIHEEFKNTNELTNYEAVPHAVAWLEEGVGMLADAFGKVHVPCVPGNHPRDSKAPRYKKRSAHNADTLISKLVAQKFRNDDRVTFDVPEGISADFKVYDTKFRIEHGDEAKGGGGIGGALVPLARHTHKRRTQAQSEGTPFDYLLMGHWHQLMFMLGQGFIVNGSGKGYDEYARGKSFAPEPPQQAMFTVTPEHGVTAQTPIFVGKRSKEGW